MPAMEEANATQVVILKFSRPTETPLRNTKNEKKIYLTVGIIETANCLRNI